MTWLLWALLLIVQNASFTLVSRARNSQSLLYHAWASLLSNGIWFASQFILFGEFFRIFKEGSYSEIAAIAAIYVVCTMVGSLGMHYIAMRKIENTKLGGANV